MAEEDDEEYVGDNVVDPTSHALMLEESEARASVWSAEITIYRKLMKQKDDRITDLEREVRETQEQLESLRTFQTMQDEDGGDRASRAALVLETLQQEVRLNAESRKYKALCASAERAKLAMFGLREQLRHANDMIDSARVSNDALLKPLQKQITELEILVQERDTQLAESRRQTITAVNEKDDLEKGMQHALKEAAEAREWVQAAQDEGQAAVRALEEMKDSIGGEIEAAVEEATSTLAEELDESYDRCDELSKANAKLKKQMDEMEQAASSSLDKIAEAEAEIEELKKKEEEESAKLDDARREVESMKMKIANHKSVAVEVGDMLKEREERIGTLEKLCSTTALDVQRLSKQQQQDKVFIDHLERLIKARNTDLGNERSKLESATLTATNALRQMKRRDAEAEDLKKETERMRESTARAMTAQLEAEKQVNALSIALEEARSAVNIFQSAKVTVSKSTQTRSTGSISSSRPGSPMSPPATAPAAVTTTSDMATGSEITTGLDLGSTEPAVDDVQSLRKGGGTSAANGRLQLVKMAKEAESMREKARLESKAAKIAREVAFQQTRQAQNKKPLVRKKFRDSPDVKMDIWEEKGMEPAESIYLPVIATRTRTSPK